ncbi:hypothetical protein BOC49_25610 [Burkholderia pseudomallei]|nr:hypothetical protein BOC49_25610 [Burkholderia pseudomallei]
MAGNLRARKAGGETRIRAARRGAAARANDVPLARSSSAAALAAVIARSGTAATMAATATAQRRRD